MASEWTPIPVANLIAEGHLVINDGYRAKNSELSIQGLPFARAQNINNGFHFKDADCFPSDDLAKVGIKISQPGDVVFTSKGTVGRFALVRPETPQFVYAPQLCFWRSLNRERLDPRWLYYWMNSRGFLVQFKGVSSQTDMADYVSLRDQRAMHIEFPDVDTQRRIAHILGSLDDKIELNRRMNGTLESMARAIFKAWFIDFEPVKAKAAGAASFRGMPQDVFDQLPNQLTDSELGPIPKGWEVVSLDKLFEVNPRRLLKKGQVAPYLAMADMPTRGHAPDRWKERAFGSGMRFQNGDTLVARITPCLENGKTAFVDFLPPGTIGWGSTEYIVLRPGPPLPPVFAYCLARLPAFRDFAITNMTGTSGRQRVAASSLTHFKATRPSGPIATAFGEVVEPMFAMSAALHSESRTLARIRDALLPKLISGEIRMAQEDSSG